MFKKILYFAFSVIAATAFAIILHGLLPGGVGADRAFDSILVLALGFPAVAILYFAVLYTQCGLAEIIFGSRLNLSKIETALRFGLPFGLIYFVGMFEPQPGTLYNTNFAAQQFWVGLGDMLPVLMGCILFSVIIIHKAQKNNVPPVKNAIPFQRRILTVLIVAGIYILERIICYHIGITTSHYAIYPWPVYIWTILFGFTLGIIVDMLLPFIYVEGSIRAFELAVLTIGLNWIWFNNFISLISKGALLTMLSRSTADVIAIYFAVVLIKFSFEANRKNLPLHLSPKIRQD